MKNLVYPFLIFLFACTQETSENLVSEAEVEEVNVETNSQEEKPSDNGNRKYTELHENGAVKIEGMNDGNGLRTGIWTSYYPDGTKWSESHYIKGMKEGHSVTFYENGQKRYIGEYKNDKQVGEWIFYDEEGNETERKVYE